MDNELKENLDTVSLLEL
ncbi:unnamed protein product, partial [Vitis vinifera]|uniref:Uncharacterized protein n=1 Tax=Vitis vinifera TaxID=29760 RepID=D7TXC3_VITVI